MRRVAFRHSLVGIIILSIIFTISWLITPVGSAPGTPLRIFSSNGEDLKVSALTYNEGPDLRWSRLGEYSTEIIPPRVLMSVGTFEMGRGQELAFDAGVEAARYVLGRADLEKPVGVYPGVLSGTSSGLAWAIATIILNDSTLRDEGVIFATGSLIGTERVGSINGLDMKLITPGLREARVIFVPAAQYDEAVTGLRERGDYQIAELVVGVSSVSEVLAYLCKGVAESKACRSVYKTPVDYGM